MQPKISCLGCFHSWVRIGITFVATVGVRWFLLGYIDNCVMPAGVVDMMPALEDVLTFCRFGFGSTSQSVDHTVDLCRYIEQHLNFLRLV